MTDTKAPEKAPGTGSQGQTFLVGENVYLRSLVPGDEKNATSWRESVFPVSPELVEKWIREDLPKEGSKNRGHLAIVRKSDDVVVGRIISGHGPVGVWLEPYVDVLYGEAGQRWLAEAIEIVARWEVDERFTPRVDVGLGAHLNVVIDTLLARDFVQTARWREMFEMNGQRVDKLLIGYFSDAWVERVGHPMESDVPRTGNGVVRPVPARAVLDGDPPKQAVMVGQRVYLRPQNKEDAKNYVDGNRRETETFFDIGRHLNTLAAWQSFVSREDNEDFPGAMWFEVCLRESDEPIGSVGLLGIDYVHRTAETGSHFYKQEYRGQGYGSEAKHLLLEYAFDVLGLHMVNSFVHIANTRSAAALRKQGYKEAGRACWLYPYEGGFGNMLTFDLLADEWRALPREG